MSTLREDVQMLRGWRDQVADASYPEECATEAGTTVPQILATYDRFIRIGEALAGLSEEQIAYLVDTAHERAVAADWIPAVAEANSALAAALEACRG